MFISNINSVILLTMLYLTELHSVNAEKQVYKQSFNYPNRRVIFTPNYYTGETLVYALCDKNFQAYENHCVVIRKDHFLQNDTRSCNFTLKKEQMDGRLGPTYGLLSFGKKNAIFISAEIGEETFIKLSTIQFDNCKVIETKFHVDFPYEESFVFVVPSNDSFKVIFENHGQCVDKMCVMLLDSNGKKIGDLSPMTNSMRRSFPTISPLESDNQLFFIKPEAGDNNNFLLWRPDGSEKSVGKYLFKSRTTILSTANDLIGVCHDTHTATSNIVCTQHYANGQLKFQFTSINKYQQLSLKSMYNLPNGGILLSAESSDGIFVVKINSNGTMLGSFDVEDFDCSKAFASGSSFFEQKNNEYCVSMVCREGNDFYIVNQTYLNFVINCFTDADFTN